MSANDSSHTAAERYLDLLKRALTFTVAGTAPAGRTPQCRSAFTEARGGVDRRQSGAAHGLSAGSRSGSDLGGSPRRRHVAVLRRHHDGPDASHAFAALHRHVYVADSFRGFPPVENNQDIGDDPGQSRAYLAVPLETVRENFRRYGLLDEQVVFLEGFFKETLHRAPIEQLAILRLDGDMYGSTMDALTALYPKLAPQGFCIIDDYGALDVCKQAVTDYRAAHGITDEIQTIDWTGVYWRKSAGG